MKFNFITLIVLLILVSCGNEVQEQIQKLDEEPHNIDPNDSFYKFETLREEHIITHLNNIIDTNEIEIREEEYDELVNWIENEVFSHNRSFSNIIEWNVNDEDFCIVRRTTSTKPNGEINSFSTINICNSILNTDVSGGDYWYYRTSSRGMFTISHHSKLIKDFGDRGYYEVQEEENGEVGLTIESVVGKYSALIQTYITYEDRELEIRKRVSTDKGYIYTGYRAFDKDDYVNSNENVKEGKKNITPKQSELRKNDEANNEQLNGYGKINKNASLEVSIGNIKFKGLSLYTSKELMLKTLGKPDKIIEPKYDCGPFSEAWQEMKFFQYFYDGMNFIVDEKGEATIQDINLKENYSIEINGVVLDKNLTFNDVVEKLEIKPNKNYDRGMVLLIPNPYLDEEYILIFENGKLSKFDRIEPC